MRHSTPHRVAHDARDRTTRAYGTMSALIDATNKVRAPRARARFDASANEKCLLTFQFDRRVCAPARRAILTTSSRATRARTGEDVDVERTIDARRVETRE